MEDSRYHRILLYSAISRFFQAAEIIVQIIMLQISFCIFFLFLISVVYLGVTFVVVERALDHI